LMSWWVEHELSIEFDQRLRCDRSIAALGRFRHFRARGFSGFV
jgi:hypothetical protein